MSLNTTQSRPSLEPEPPGTRQEQRMILFTAGIWLIFLVWTVLGFLNSTASLPAQILGWVALAIFPVVYLVGFLHPKPLPRANLHLNTAAYSAVLIILGLCMSQSTPTAIINVVPYVMAQWIFNHRIASAFIAVGLIFGAAGALVVLVDFGEPVNWFLPAVGAPTIVMAFIRISMEMGIHQQYRSEQLALAKQREELASTVHDVLGHSLTTITVKIQLAQRLLEADLDTAKTELADIEALARRSLSEVRSTVTDLQHPDLAEQLNQAATALAAANVDFARPERLPKLTLVQQQVFAWVVREAVTNIIRHAQASAATLIIAAEETDMVLRIDDDGVGVSEAECTKHHGLAGLQRRVTSAGGSLNIIRLDPGTRLEVIL
ncbi:MAG: sensor histidine kinase [Micrococcaceae bacterium]|nr:sensor histidine kinase [Micrococcaceae bacterium]